jgi:hypothetical protein
MSTATAPTARGAHANKDIAEVVCLKKQTWKACVDDSVGLVRRDIPPARGHARSVWRRHSALFPNALRPRKSRVSGCRHIQPNLLVSAPRSWWNGHTSKHLSLATARTNFQHETTSLTTHHLTSHPRPSRASSPLLIWHFEHRAILAPNDPFRICQISLFGKIPVLFSFFSPFLFSFFRMHRPPSLPPPRTSSGTAPAARTGAPRVKKRPAGSALPTRVVLRALPIRVAKTPRLGSQGNRLGRRKECQRLTKTKLLSPTRLMTNPTTRVRPSKRSSGPTASPSCRDPKASRRAHGVSRKKPSFATTTTTTSSNRGISAAGASDTGPRAGCFATSRLARGGGNTKTAPRI